MSFVEVFGAHCNTYIIDVKSGVCQKHSLNYFE